MEIQLNGTSYKLVFNTNSLSDFHDQTGINPLSDQLTEGDSISPKVIKYLTYYGIKEGCRIDKVDPPSAESVGEWMTFDKLSDVFKAFAETMPKAEKK